MPGIALEKISKRFEERSILARLDLHVGPLEFLAVVGPSGAGKTTLLRLIAGLEEPDEGRILLNDRDVTSLPPEKRDMAMVFQNHALYPHLTVQGNLEFPLRLRGIGRDEMKIQVHEVATLLKLIEALPRRPAELSGGEAQRVALGRALIRQPAALLLDEPLSSLPPDLRFQLRGELIRLHRAKPRPTIYVTHDHEEALALGSRVAVLHEGRIQQIGTPQEIYERPANRFVAGFVGRPAMNFLTGDPVRGVRPEHLEICAEGEALVRGRVESVQYLGAFTDVLARTDGGEVVARLFGKNGFQPGDPLSLRARPENIHCFDAQTGKRK